MYFGTIPKSVMLTHWDELEEMDVPCGRCIGCRLEKSRKWAMRCVMEAQQHKDNCFLTLTYAPEFLPADGSLVKRDLQLFIKRLRKAFSGVKIRYFACGEYGEKFARPHYHLILFGFCPLDYRSKKCTRVSSALSCLLSPSDSLRPPAILLNQSLDDDSNLTVTYSRSIESIWGLGHVAVGDMTFESAAYVARYCLKKITGDDADEHYQGRQPEFIVMSRKPGIAADWFDKFSGDVYPGDKCFARGVLCKPPRYFDKLLEKLDPLLYTEIKEARKQYAKKHSLDFERLEAAEELAQIKMKKISRKYENTP